MLISKILSVYVAYLKKKNTKKQKTKKNNMKKIKEI